MRTGILSVLVFALACSGGGTGSTPPPEVASILVTPSTGSLVVDATSQLTATPKTAGGATVAGQTIDWSSAPLTVAIVSSSGLVTAVSPGTATISARVGGITGTASITVTSPPLVVSSILVSPSTTPMLVDATSQLTATPQTASGATVPGQTITWTSLPTAVAIVSNSGVVTAVSPGTATIRAQIGSITGTATVTVTRPPLAPFLSRPFDGDFLTSNPMDHDTPREFVDPFNGNHIAFWGVNISAFDTHSGYDFTMPIGTPLRAAAGGTVVLAQSSNFFCPVLGRNVDQIGVVIEHTRPGGYKVQTYYAHLSTLAVTAGQVVATGAPIGLSGNTGCTTSPHLHFQVDRVNVTNNGQLTHVDPYGWTGAAQDPWQANANGAESVNLWLPGQAPKVLVGYNKITTPLNGPQSGPSPKAVGLTTIVYTGPNEATDPNSEFLELEIDPAVQPSGSFDLTGSYLRNNAGTRYDFPAGTILQQGQTLRLYVGSGVNSANTLYWGRPAAIFTNTGECVQLRFPGGSYYLLGYVVGCN